MSLLVTGASNAAVVDTVSGAGGGGRLLVGPFVHTVTLSDYSVLGYLPSGTCSSGRYGELCIWFAAGDGHEYSHWTLGSLRQYPGLQTYCPPRCSPPGERLSLVESGPSGMAMLQCGRGVALTA